MPLRSTLAPLLLACAALAASPAAAVTLLTNGDFEVVDGRVGSVGGHALNALDTGRWDVYDTLPGGWYTSDGAGIEVQHSGTVVNAYSGSHYVELDSHPSPDSNSSMSLDLKLDEGDYLLEFVYQPRTSVLDDNGVHVLFDGAGVATADGVRTGDTDWVRYRVSLFDVELGLHTLTFSAFGLENTLGGFIDAVTFEPLLRADHDAGAPVPEPGAALVFALGLAAVGLRLRR